MTLVKELKPLFAADKLTGCAFLYSLKWNELPEAILSDAAHPSVFVKALETKLKEMPNRVYMDRMTVCMYTVLHKIKTPPLLPNIGLLVLNRLIV